MIQSESKSTISKVSHTLTASLASRLEDFAFFQRVSESSVIEKALLDFFGDVSDDNELGAELRRSGAGRRRKSTA
jgi:hypothetical protein